MYSDFIASVTLVYCGPFDVTFILAETGQAYNEEQFLEINSSDENIFKVLE